ncbi:MAG: DUF3276 family protein [Treponema sp.]|nr:DUF3276 family protein [Treponema sp.]
MGVRGEVFSTKVSLQNRTYFFNVKENRLGDLYLNIVESKNRDEGGFERQSIILFAEDLQKFLQGFDESLKVLEKSVREKRRGAPSREARPRGDSAREPFSPRPPREGYSRGEGRSEGYGRGEGRGDAPFRGRSDSGAYGERRFGESRGESSGFRRERPPRPRGEGYGRGDAPFRGRGGRDDGEAPRRSGRFGEKPPRKSEGRPRREERGGRDRPSSPAKKRVVVKKR